MKSSLKRVTPTITRHDAEASHDFEERLHHAIGANTKKHDRRTDNHDQFRSSCMHSSYPLVWSYTLWRHTFQKAGHSYTLWGHTFSRLGIIILYAVVPSAGCA